MNISGMRERGEERFAQIYAGSLQNTSRALHTKK